MFKKKEMLVILGVLAAFSGSAISFAQTGDTTDDSSCPMPNDNKQLKQLPKEDNAQVKKAKAGTGKPSTAGTAETDR